MPVTNLQQEYKRLRAFLNPFLRGSNTNAVLYALAAGNSMYLTNTAAAVHDQLYIPSASGTYLDQLLAAYQIVRPSYLGLSDEIFSEIGIQVKNRKQVRDLINNILNIIFGNQLTNATNNSSVFEPYKLTNGDTLIINFDERQTTTITFSTNQFENISIASAQEVADAITETLRNLGFAGTAISNNDGNGNYVQLISNTIGPSSSITVLGGSAQNQLKFPSIVTAGGNSSTQWTISLQPGGIVRFTWTGGADPIIGAVSVGNYVNIYGGGFLNSGYEGTYTIINSVGGSVDFAYFEVQNFIAPTPGISFNPVIQGGNTSNPSILFFNPSRQVISKLYSYAALYQTKNRLNQIFIPPATKVIRRVRIGSAHLHYKPNIVFSFLSNPNVNDQFSITDTITLTAGIDFAIEPNFIDTMSNLAASINTFTGLTAITGINSSTNNNIVTIYQDITTITLTGIYSGIASISSSGLLGDPISVQSNQQGPYVYDLSQTFVISATGTKLTQNLDGTDSRVFTVADSSQFPDSIGYLVLDYGYENQEGPIPYIGRPSDNTLIISPAYTIKNPHIVGADVALISVKAPITITKDGLDYPFYITDTVSGRIYAQNLIDSVTATGINSIFTILYPNDIGLGKWGTIYTENPQIWGD